LRAARSYALHRHGSIAFAVRTATAGFGWRERRTFPSASVLKAMLLVAYLDEHAVRHRDLRPRERALLAPMIRRSDNYAAEVVRDMVGPRRIRRLARVAGMRDFDYNPIWGLSRSSPRDQVRFMYHLQRYIPKRRRPYARFLLSHVVGWQRWGIGRVVPEGWRLFLKGGWGSGTGLVDHQVALLKHRRKRVALAIYTEFQPDHAYGKKTLRGVAARLLGGLGD
jgi:hypothetical protein